MREIGRLLLSASELRPAECFFHVMDYVMNITDIKKSAYILIQSGNLSTQVLNDLMPNGVPIPIESELWDFGYG